MATQTRAAAHWGQPGCTSSPLGVGCEGRWLPARVGVTRSRAEAGSCPPAPRHAAAGGHRWARNPRGFAPCWWVAAARGSLLGRGAGGDPAHPWPQRWGRERARPFPSRGIAAAAASLQPQQPKAPLVPSNPTAAQAGRECAAWPSSQLGPILLICLITSTASDCPSHRSRLLGAGGQPLLEPCRKGPGESRGLELLTPMDEQSQGTSRGKVQPAAPGQLLR